MLPGRRLLAALTASLLLTGTLSTLSASPAAAADSPSEHATPHGMMRTRDGIGQATPRRTAGFAGTSTCAPIFSSAQCGDLINHGGPVMPTVQSYTIFWAPPSNPIAASYVTAVNTFFGDIGTGAFYDSVLQYPGSNGAPQDTHSFAGTRIDTTPYPAGRGTPQNPLFDTDIQNAVSAAIAANPSWGPPGLTRAYHVLLPKNVYVSDPDGNFKSFVDFCAYHYAFGSASKPAIYTTLPYAGTTLAGCGTGAPYPSGNADIDSTISLASHELMEVATDPLGNAWFDNFGNENGDLCAYVYGSRAADGGNVTLNGHRYVLQLEWSNADDTSPPSYHAACVNRFPHVLRVSPVSTAPGTSQTATITAQDANADTVTTYTGTVHFTSSDPSAALPGDVTFNAADHGVKQVSVTFATNGAQTLTATDTLEPRITGTSGTVRRIAGDDRIGTAVLASQDVWPAVGAAGDHAGTAVIARSDEYADALAGVPLAGSKHGPVLLTPPSGLDSRVATEVQRILPTGTTVYVLGGPAALPPDVDGSLQHLGYQVARLAGDDRYATAVAIATNGLQGPTTVLLATGTGFADALGAGAAASHIRGAVLLTAGSTMPTATANYLNSHSGTRYAVGGPAAAADPGATGIVGTDRYDTATLVANRFFATITTVDIATGTAFPDALGGGAHAAAHDIPLVLTDPTTLPSSLGSYLQGQRDTITGVVIFGGTAAVSDSVVAQISAALA